MDITKMTNNEIATYLREQRNCAFILWQTEDIIERAKDGFGIELTEDQAIEIMIELDSHADCEYGISWHNVNAEVHDYLLTNDLIPDHV